MRKQMPPNPDPTGWGNDLPPWLACFVTVAAILILAWGVTGMFTEGALDEAAVPHVARPATGGMVVYLGEAKP
jgi:hypothetical protein